MTLRLNFTNQQFCGGYESEHVWDYTNAVTPTDDARCICGAFTWAAYCEQQRQRFEATRYQSNSHAADEAAKRMNG